MVQANTFGNLRYDEDEHGWALEVGLYLATWISWYGALRSIAADLIDECRDQASKYKAVVTQRLRAHNIQVDLPDFDDYFEGSVEATQDMIMESVRTTHSPEVCAFALIGEAASYFHWPNRTEDPNIILIARSNSRGVIEKLQQKCHALFPGGVPEEAIFERLSRTKGSLVQLRQLLLDLRKPMVILLVLSDPVDGGRLRLLNEQQRLTDSLAQSLHRDRFQIEVLSDARLDNFGPTLAQWKPTIIHFSGHGSETGIFLNGPTGQATRIDPSRLSRLLWLAGQDNLQGVVMNACFTAEMFLAQGGMLDQQAVVMEGELSDATALSFAQQFYAYLGNGRSFKNAFMWAHASADLTGSEGLQASFFESGGDISELEYWIRVQSVANQTQYGWV